MRSKNKSLPTQDRLHELFYCVGGQLITKIHKPHSKNYVGDVIGCMNRHGYLCTNLDQKQYLVHRLVWKYYYGTDPKYILDHIDRNKTNNNIWNLRESDHIENNRNNTRTMDNHDGQLQTQTIDGKRVYTEYGREMNRMMCRRLYHKKRNTPG